MATQTIEEHQQGQEALAALILPMLAKAWANVDLQDLKGTLPTFKAIVAAILQRFGLASSVAAMDFYEAERLAAGVTGKVSIKLPDEIPLSVIDAAVDSATTLLRPLPKTDLPQGGLIPDQQLAMDRLNAEAERLVLDQGRRTLIDAVQNDRKAKGWVRVTKPGACSFCLMLALRGGAGMLYTSKWSANFRAHTVKPDGSGGLCRCSVAPVFTAYEPSAHMREMQKLWEDATKGRSGADARNAFRQAVEGRPITGLSGAKKPRDLLGKSNMDRPQAEFLLAQAQRMKDSPWRTKQIARLTKILAGN